MQKLLVSALVLVAAPAFADRYTRADVTFSHLCTSCHHVGFQVPAPDKEHGRVDLTRVVDRIDDRTLQRFLADPRSVRKETACQHPPLSDDDAQDLMFYLHMRALPAPRIPQVPPRSTHLLTTRRRKPPGTETGATLNPSGGGGEGQSVVGSGNATPSHGASGSTGQNKAPPRRRGGGAAPATGARSSVGGLP